MKRLSVIVPLAPGEKAWRELLKDLAILPPSAEIIVVASEERKVSREYALLPGKEVHWLTTTQSGRAIQLNAGARVARGEYLWFLHADSRFGRKTLCKLFQTLERSPRDLLYFDLAFLRDGPFLTRINGWGVCFRSRLWGLPFGDQGLCLREDLFHALGGFSEEAPYGEGHLLVWRAKQKGVRITPVGTTLYTSARKYREQGWLKTTLSHQYLWIKQMWPEWRRLRKSKKKQKVALAIFAKTPGLSPVKTRLGADIGQSLADEFYRLSLEAISQVAEVAQRELSDTLVAYWALAESKAVTLECWSQFPALWTGGQELGAALHEVSLKMLHDHDYLIIIGVDTPQLTLETIQSALRQLKKDPFSCVIGPSTDGGFYLFGTGKIIPENIWKSVIYSREDTLAQLERGLASVEIPVHFLSLESDVDRGKDLLSLGRALEAIPNPLPAHEKLYQWLQKQTGLQVRKKSSSGCQAEPLGE